MIAVVRKIGKVILIIGILAMITGVVFSFTVGTFITPIILFSSIVLNALGITMLRSGKH